MNHNKSIVLIPHYNNPQGLIKSIQSIGVTEKIDVIIVDDGSSNIFQEEECDSAFRAIGNVYYKYLESNEGIEAAMNTGLRFAQDQGYLYIARLDCGDINVENRFKLQEEFLDKHPDILLVGSHSHYVDLDGNTVFTQVNPIEPEKVQKRLFIACPFVHPTIMFSVKVFEFVKGYTTKYPYAEDYALYMELNQHGVKMANIDQVLLLTEDNPDGISLSKRKEQQQTKLKLLKDYFEFNLYSIIGFVRTFIVSLTPYPLLLTLKKLFK